jgi:hypothetical protein
MNEPDATFTNGRYELPLHGRGVLVLADPPEAGWRMVSPAAAELSGGGSAPGTGGNDSGDSVAGGGY